MDSASEPGVRGTCFRTSLKLIKIIINSNSYLSCFTLTYVLYFIFAFSTEREHKKERKEPRERKVFTFADQLPIS